MLDEQALRRETFVPGVPVVLADGQEWSLRKPVVRFVPADNEAGFERCLSLDGSDTFEAVAAAYENAEAAGDVIRGELSLGKAVLLANYDLTPPQVASLLKFGYDDDDAEGQRLRKDVVGVATGLGKGRSDAGGD